MNTDIGPSPARYSLFANTALHYINSPLRAPTSLALLADATRRSVLRLRLVSYATSRAAPRRTVSKLTAVCSLSPWDNHPTAAPASA